MFGVPIMSNSTKQTLKASVQVKMFFVIIISTKKKLEKS